MARTGGRLTWAALAAGAALGCLFAAPLQAQGVRRMDSRALLATINAAPLPKGGGVSCGKLPGCELCLISDGQSARPACIILRLPEGAEDATAAETLQGFAERFLNSYKLKGYRPTLAGDASAVFLFREDKSIPGRQGGKQALQALSDGLSLGPAIRWLNERCGGVPHSFSGTQLHWRRQVTVGSNSRELSVTLDLQQGAPAYVDIRLNQVALAKVDEAISAQLLLELEPVSGEKGAALRRRLGVKPMGYMEEKPTRRGQQLPAGICLVRVGGENGLYRLAETTTLQKMRERTGKGSESAFPAVKEASWPEEEAGQTTAAAPRPVPTAPAVAPPAPSRSEDSERPQSAVNGFAPTAAPSAADAPAMPTPAAAREAYAERLRAL